MSNIIKLDNDEYRVLEDLIFPKIYNGECVLFLGAGASVTDDHTILGSHLLHYYSDLLNIEPETTDLVEFVDFLNTQPNFIRRDFDNYVSDILTRLEYTEAHKTIATLNWKEIITTNLDLLIEDSFHDVFWTT